jgi:hypothetical protein
MTEQEIKEWLGLVSPLFQVADLPQVELVSEDVGLVYLAAARLLCLTPRKALGTDSRWCRIRAARFGRHGDHAGDLIAALAAEAAAHILVLLWHGVHRPELRTGDTGADHAGGHLGASFTDAHAWADKQVAGFMLRSSAE